MVQLKLPLCRRQGIYLLKGFWDYEKACVDYIDFLMSEGDEKSSVHPHYKYDYCGFDLSPPFLGMR